MSVICTHEVFKRFQFLGLSGPFVLKEHKDDQITTFKILDFEKNEELDVEWNASKEDISCLYRSFELGSMARISQVR